MSWFFTNSSKASVKHVPKKTRYKGVLIGDGGVGKTTYHDRLTNEETKGFKVKRSYKATEDHRVSELVCIDKFDNTITIDLFDTAGQEKYGKLRNSYLMGADFIIIMYDVTNRRTFDNVKKWLQNVIKLYKSCDQTPPPVVVCGNKTDLSNRYGPTELHHPRESVLRGNGYYDGNTVSYIPISVWGDLDLWKPLDMLVQKVGNYPSDPLLVPK